MQSQWRATKVVYNLNCLVALEQTWTPRSFPPAPGLVFVSAIARVPQRSRSGGDNLDDFGLLNKANALRCRA